MRNSAGAEERGDVAQRIAGIEQGGEFRRRKAVAADAETGGEFSHERRAAGPPLAVAEAGVAGEAFRENPAEQSAGVVGQCANAVGNLLVAAERAQFLQRSEDVEREAARGLGEECGDLLLAEAFGVALEVIFNNRERIRLGERLQIHDASVRTMAQDGEGLVLGLAFRRGDDGGNDAHA